MTSIGIMTKKKKKEIEEMERIQQLSANELADEYKRKASESCSAVLDLIQLTTGWDKEPVNGLKDATLFSRPYHKNQKVFKLEATIDASVEELFTETVLGYDNTASWNPSIKDAKILKVIDDNTDVVYNLVGEVAGGLVDSRDFVNVRQTQRHGCLIISGGCAVMYPDMPPSKKTVRAKNRLTGMIFMPHPDDCEKTLYTCVLNCDIKGMILQAISDKALSGIIIDYVVYLRKHMAELKAAR